MSIYNALRPPLESGAYIYGKNAIRGVRGRRSTYLIKGSGHRKHGAFVLAPLYSTLASGNIVFSIDKRLGHGEIGKNAPTYLGVGDTV
jgi:hypothetical protein